MNVELLKKVANHIKEHPETYDQHVFGMFYAPRRCCITRHALLLTDKSRYLMTDAIQVLNLTDEQFDNITFLSRWPSSFQEQMDNAKDKTTKANIAYERIHYFIETGL